MRPRLFPALPEDLAGAELEQLTGIREQYRDVARQVQDGTIDLEPFRALGMNDDEIAEEVVTQMRAAKDDLATLKTEIDGREAAAQTFVDETTALAAELGADDEDEEGDGTGAGGDEGDEAAGADAEGAGEGDEAAAVAVGAEATATAGAESEDGDGDAEGDGDDEGVTAATTPPTRMTLPGSSTRHQARPATGTAGPVALVASSELQTLERRRIREGDELDRAALASTMVQVAKAHGPVRRTKNGGETRIPLASARFAFDESMVLRGDDHAGNLEKIAAIGSPFLGRDSMEALVASGGICAPPTPFYDVPGFASRERPVRDTFASFNAVRGGVLVPSVSTIGSITSAITVIEEADDAQGGTFATKSCQDMECADWTEVLVGIISHCREYGNLNARTWPEGIALENDNTMAAHSRVADRRLLDRIKVLSLEVTAGHVYNAMHDFIYAALRAKASIRNLLRAPLEGLGYTVLAPEWLIELFQADSAAMDHEEKYVSRARIEAILGQYDIRVSWYKDSPTGAGQDFGAEVDSTGVDNFPSIVEWSMSINGSFIHLDGGDLELGLVRDSSLNSSNDYQMFGETFENIARIGPLQGTRWFRSTICPSGQHPALASALTC
jgi:hypothetical protein